MPPKKVYKVRSIRDGLLVSRRPVALALELLLLENTLVLPSVVCYILPILTVPNVSNSLQSSEVVSVVVGAIVIDTMIVAEVAMAGVTTTAVDTVALVTMTVMTVAAIVATLVATVTIMVRVALIVTLVTTATLRVGMTDVEATTSVPVLQVVLPPTETLLVKTTPAAVALVGPMRIAASTIALEWWVELNCHRSFIWC